MCVQCLCDILKRTVKRLESLCVILGLQMRLSVIVNNKFSCRICFGMDTFSRKRAVITIVYKY